MLLSSYVIFGAGTSGGAGGFGLFSLIFFPLGGVFSKLPSLLPISGAGKYGGFGCGGSCGLFAFFMVRKFMSKKQYYK